MCIRDRISISKERRICLPTFLGVPEPYVLVEITRTEQLWLGLCSLDSLASLNAECCSLRVMAEYRTQRPTISKAVCDMHGLSANEAIWLVAMGNVIEIWSELSWQTMITNSSDLHAASCLGVTSGAPT